MFQIALSLCHHQMGKWNPVRDAYGCKVFGEMSLSNSLIFICLFEDIIHDFMVHHSYKIAVINSLSQRQINDLYKQEANGPF